MRLRCSGQRRLNETLLELSVARYSRTGMATIPKLMTPFQIDRGIVHHLGGRIPLLRAACRANRNGSVKEAHEGRRGRPTTRTEAAARAWPDRLARARERPHRRSLRGRNGERAPRRRRRRGTRGWG